MSNDGATVNPYAETNTDSCLRPPGEKDNGIPRKGKHLWQWVWKDGHITDTVQCSACGEIRRNTDGNNETLVKGYGNVDPV